MNEKPKLGTIDSALVSCVNLIAAVTSTRAEDLISWLDLYYQVRKSWEIEQGNEPNPTLIRKDELLPILEATVREALRGTARKAAETVAENQKQIQHLWELTATEQEKKKRKPAAKDQDRSLSPSGSSPSQEEPKRGQDEAEPATAKKPGPWTLYKRKIYDRLLQVRAEGYAIAQIAACSGGTLSEGRVMAAINAAQLRQEEWRALETALDAVTLLQIPANPGGGA